MRWEIKAFEGVGPIRFGMVSSEVEAILGPPDRKRKGDDGTEYRGEYAPIITYYDGRVAELECYYDLPDVSFDGIPLFQQHGLDVMRQLERRNGGALESVGIVVFQNLGLSTGRLDRLGREDHSVTAFARGLWQDRIDRLQPISFL